MHVPKDRSAASWGWRDRTGTGDTPVGVGPGPRPGWPCPVRRGRSRALSPRPASPASVPRTAPGGSSPGRGDPGAPVPCPPAPPRVSPSSRETSASRVLTRRTPLGHPRPTGLQDLERGARSPGLRLESCSILAGRGAKSPDPCGVYRPLWGSCAGSRRSVTD